MKKANWEGERHFAVAAVASAAAVAAAVAATVES